ncbi:MAG: signal peptidase I [bacterium]|nr:signal peptidase I [bacterium]
MSNPQDTDQHTDQSYTQSDSQPHTDVTAPIPAEELLSTDTVAETTIAETDPPKSATRVALGWVTMLAAALALALLLRSVLFQAYYIRFTSMEPTLQNGDRVLVQKAGNSLDRGDLIVFGRPSGVSGMQSDDLIKRVIALPGEVIKLQEGVVYINNQRLHEPYLDSNRITTGDLSLACPEMVGEGCLVGENEVFVMGDNRTNSTDSRTFGPILTNQIVGQAILRLWPIGDFGRI